MEYSKKKKKNSFWNCEGGLPLLETGGGVAMFEGARSGSWGGTTMARAWNGTRGTCFDTESVQFF